MEVNEINYPELYKLAAEVTFIANNAAKKAREENFRLGLPNVIGNEGKVYHEFEDGRIIQIFPQENI